MENNCGMFIGSGRPRTIQKILRGENVGTYFRPLAILMLNSQLVITNFQVTANPYESMILETLPQVYSPIKSNKVGAIFPKQPSDLSTKSSVCTIYNLHKD